MPNSRLHPWLGPTSNWDQVSLPYAGWVPTSQGRLAYARIGDSRHPDVAVFANIELNGVAAAPEVRDRLLLGYQHRSLGDGAFKHRIAKWFLNQSGDFWFVLAGRTADSRTEEACLRGAVYI